MIIRDVIKANGLFKVYINDELKHIIPNRLMDFVLSQYRYIFQGIATDCQIKYLLLGTGTTPVTNTDTQLANEVMRLPVLNQTEWSTDTLVTDFTLLNTDLIGVTITEMGIACGASATATVNTGNLMSRVLCNIPKTADMEINFQRQDDLVRGG